MEIRIVISKGTDNMGEDTSINQYSFYLENNEFGEACSVIEEGTCIAEALQRLIMSGRLSIMVYQTDEDLEAIHREDIITDIFRQNQKVSS